MKQKPHLVYSHRAGRSEFQVQWKQPLQHSKWPMRTVSEITGSEHNDWEMNFVIEIGRQYVGSRERNEQTWRND